MHDEVHNHDVQLITLLLVEVFEDTSCTYIGIVNVLSLIQQ